MNKKILTVFAAILTFTVFHKAAAQENTGNWQIGVNGGLFVYQGDLTPSDAGSYKTAQPTFGAYVSRVLSPALLLRANLAVGHLAGNDALYNSPAWRQQRNYRFNTAVTELSGLIVWNMLSNNQNQMGHRLSPYLFGGIGASFLRVSRDTSRFNTHYFASNTNMVNGLRADMGRATPRAALVVPVGIGIEYYLSGRLSLTGETTFRYSATDYLDGFSLGANPGGKDFYHSHTIGLLYRFKGKDRMDCPAVPK